MGNDKLLYCQFKMSKDACKVPSLTWPVQAVCFPNNALKLLKSTSSCALHFFECLLVSLFERITVCTTCSFPFFKAHHHLNNNQEGRKEGENCHDRGFESHTTREGKIKETEEQHDSNNRNETSRRNKKWMASSENRNGKKEIVL